MNEHSELLPNLLSEDAFEVQMRGYSRRQVDEYVARTRSQTRDLEERLARALDEAERLRAEFNAVRQQAGAKAPHEEVSERMAQILNLAHEEARAQKARAGKEIDDLRDDAQRRADTLQREAREQAERTLNSAQEQAEQLVAAARAEADKTRQTARAEAERATATVRKEADEVRANANSKAERMLAEATARADAINDGAARRLELLSGTHAEAARRLTEIRDVVTDLLRQDSSRGSLEDEVAETVAAAMREPASPGAGSQGPGRDGGHSGVPGGPADAGKADGDDARRSPGNAAGGPYGVPARHAGPVSDSPGAAGPATARPTSPGAAGPAAAGPGSPGAAGPAAASGPGVHPSPAGAPGSGGAPGAASGSGASGTQNAPGTPVAAGASRAPGPRPYAVGGIRVAADRPAGDHGPASKAHRSAGGTGLQDATIPGEQPGEQAGEQPGEQQSPPEAPAGANHAPEPDRGSEPGGD